MDQPLKTLEQELVELRRLLEKLVRRHDDLDQRLLELENSRLFRALRWPGRMLLDWKGRLGQILLHSPLHPAYVRVARPRAAREQYQLWVEVEQAAMPTAAWHAARARELKNRPSFSILLPVHNPKREWLEDAVESVLNQSYGCWELCVCDDASREDWIAEYFSQKAAADSRIHFRRSPQPLGISGATNHAGEVARGDYVGFLDQDDALSPHALYYVAESLQRQGADLIYSDEDRLDARNRRVEPIFKPAWSPNLLLSCMYLGHFLVVKKDRLDRAGWLRSAFDGSQDYDLVLRIADDPAVTVRHLPRILYHWRMHPGSTAASRRAKPYAWAAGRSALTDALRRRGVDAEVEKGPAANSFRLRRRLPTQPQVSLVICSRNPRLLGRCLRSIDRKTSYANRQVVVIQHAAGHGYYKMRAVLERHACASVLYAGSFNFAAMNNLGAEKAAGEILVFLNDDTRPLDSGWLTALVTQAQRPEVGIVGARLLYPTGAIQHAGLAIGIMGGVGHLHRDTFSSPFWSWLPFPRDVSAVTGACLAMRRSVFRQLGGFDTAFAVNYNDADLCLRACRAGYQVLYEPAALLRHDECRTRLPGVRYAERELWQERWAESLARGDPFYSPHLSNTREDVSLRLDQAGLPSLSWR